MDNIKRYIWVLGFKETWAEQATGRIQWKRIVIAALGSQAQCVDIDVEVP